MQKKQNNEENLRKYQQRLTGLGNLPAVQTLDEILAEPTSKEVKPQPKNLDFILANISKNPYVRARNIVLSKYIAWKKIEILQLEKTGEYKTSRHYDDFVREVRELGDTL